MLKPCKLKFRKFNIQKLDTVFQKIKTNDINKEVARFIIKNLVICTIVAFLEIMGLMFILGLFFNIWIAILVAVVLRILFEYVNLTATYYTFNFVFRHFPFMLSIYEEKKELNAK